MSVAAELTDSELVGRMASGDREAFGTLFRRHQATVYRFSRQMLGSKDAAEDVTQDVFVALAKNARTFDPAVGSLTTYLYGIARNLILQRNKRRHGRVEIDIDSIEESGVLTTTTDPTHGLAKAQMVRQLRLAILRLPVHYREMIVLCELNGLSYEDAAAVARCPVGTVRSRLSRGRQMLIARCRISMKAEECTTANRALKAGDAKKWLMLTKNNC